MAMKITVNQHLTDQERLERLTHCATNCKLRSTRRAIIGGCSSK